jgi:maleylacetate reductase
MEPGSSGINKQPQADVMESGSLALLRQPIVHYSARLRDTLARIATDRNSQRVLPIVTGSLRRHPMVEEAMTTLGSRMLPIFSDLKPHTPFDVVVALTARIGRERPDLIAVIGGGSAMDAAKISSLATAGAAADAKALLALRAVPGTQGEMTPSPVSRAIPIVAVPTTLSAAEFGMIGGATDTTTGIKHIFKSDTLAPDIVVFDPRLTVATPSDLWLSTGVRSLDHGIETVLSLDASPYTDALALRGLTLLSDGLRRSAARPEDVAARHSCQLGVWLAACGIGRIRYGASHGLGHQLGAAAGVPHGLTSCVLLPAVLAFNEPVSPERQNWIAEACGGLGRPASEVVRELIASLGLPTRLSQLGVDAAILPRVAESALGNAFVKANPRPVASVNDAMEILRAAY